eukprot:scpid87099/ scgid11745/ 
MPFSFPEGIRHSGTSSYGNPQPTSVLATCAGVPDTLRERKGMRSVECLTSEAGGRKHCLFVCLYIDGSGKSTNLQRWKITLSQKCVDSLFRCLLRASDFLCDVSCVSADIRHVGYAREDSLNQRLSDVAGFIKEFLISYVAR